MKINALSGLLLATGLLASAAVQAYDVELALSYDTEAENYAKSQGTTAVQMIKGMVNNTNAAFAEQNIPIKLVINNIAKLDLNIHTRMNNDYMTRQSKFRTAYNADYAFHLNRMVNGCGFAGLRTSTSGYPHHSFYGVVKISCSWREFAHELGHSFGLDDPIRDINPDPNVFEYAITPPGQFTGVYPYGGGYSEFGRFATIMVGNYASQFFGGGEKVGLFSDSKYQHSKYGRIGDAGRDSARALRNISKYLPDADKCQSISNPSMCTTNFSSDIAITVTGYDYGFCKDGCKNSYALTWSGGFYSNKIGHQIARFKTTGHQTHGNTGNMSTGAVVTYSIRDWDNGGKISVARTCAVKKANFREFQSNKEYQLFFAVAGDQTDNCFVVQL